VSVRAWREQPGVRVLRNRHTQGATTRVADPRSDLTAILMTQTMFESFDPPQAHKDFRRAAFQSTQG
jgi:hypothetical protein